MVLSLSGMFVRWAQAPGLVTSFYRMLTAALILLPVNILRSRGKSGRRQNSSQSSLSWIVFPAAGGLFTALDHSTWSTAIATTQVANATLLNNIAPLWVALYAALVWGERLRSRFWLGLVITLAGAVLVLSSGIFLSPQQTGGNLLALCSSMFYAAYFLVTQRGRSRLDALTYVCLVTIFAAVSLLAISRILRLPLAGFVPQTWLIFLAAGLVSQIGGYFSIAYALGHLPASVVSPTMILQPVLTALLAYVFAGETLAPLQWVGGLAAVGGIFLINISRGETL
jgi:drug/metabolite transporter (DMT)-like permease